MMLKNFRLHKPAEATRYELVFRLEDGCGSAFRLDSSLRRYQANLEKCTTVSLAQLLLWQHSLYVRHNVCTFVKVQGRQNAVERRDRQVAARSLVVAVPEALLGRA